MFITDDETLRDFCARIREAGRVAFDTEFMRERTYYAKLCLVQVSADGIEAAVDPLSVDLDPLFEVLTDARILKVVHAGQQDLEIVYQAVGRVPAPVFDTQVAATVAGFSSQVAYGALVKEILGVELPKSHRYTDWCVRPLSDAQMRYALDDVRYLPALHDALSDRLREDGRLDWLAPELERMSDPDVYRSVPERQYRRVKGHASLDRRGLAVLQQVAAWREREAQQRDVPRKWVLGDETLIEVARRKPRSRDELQTIRGVKGKLRSSAGDQVLSAVRAGLSAPDEDLPAATKRRVRPRDIDALVDLMSSLVRLRAREHAVAAQSLATRDELERLAAGERGGSPLLEGWRWAVVGDDLIGLLDGRIMMRVVDGVVVTERWGD